MMHRTSIFALLAAGMTFAAAGVNIAVKVSVDSRIGSVSLNPSLGPYTGGSTYESESWQGDTAFTITANNVSVGYTAYWEIVTNDVRASSGGIGTAITIPSTPHRPGTQTSVYAGCTVRFYVTANTYTVNLNQEGGSGGSSSVTATYDAAMLPMGAIPKRQGYTFGGYYTAADGGGTQYYYSDGTSARTWNIAVNNTTLYAKWTARQYTLNVNPNGGSHWDHTAAYEVGYLVTGTSRYRGIGVATRSGYTFEGFYDASTGGTKVYDGNAQAVDGTYWSGNYPTVLFKGLANASATALTVYARWTANTYAVTLDQQSGSNGTSSVTATYDAAMPAVTKPSRTGYTFGGYYTGENGGGTQYYDATGASARTWDLAADNTTLYAKWTAKEYEVTLNQQPGSGGTDSVTATYDAAMPGITVPSRTGYAFGGYYTGQDGSGTQYYTASGESAANWHETVSTLYAKWTANQYTVTFDANGGSVSPDTKSVTYASTYGNLPTPTLADHSFVGWFTAQSGGEQVTSSTSVSITGNQTLYARWAQESYEVWFRAFDKNGEVIGGSFQTITMGENAYLKSFNTLAITPPDGYSFTNWNTAMDGSGVSHEDHENVFNLTNVANATVTLYAQWEPNPYQVAFQPNGADGEMDPLLCTYDVPTNLPPCAFTNTGYAFKGWSTTTNRPSLFYADGEEVVNLATGGVVNLYANWTGIVYTVTFDANGGTGTIDSMLCTYDVPTNLPAASEFTPRGLARDGWGFKGWTNSLAEGVLFLDHARVTNLTTRAEEVQMYACWTGTTYAVVLDASADTRGNGVMTNGFGVEVSVLTNFYVVGEAWDLPSPTNVNENLVFAGWKYGDNQTATGEVPSPSSGSTNLVAAWSWKTDDLGAAVDAPELGFRTFGTVGNKGKPNESEYSANWFAQRNCFFNDGVSTNAVQSGALPANTKDSKVYVSWLTTMVETNGVLSFWWKCDAKPLIEAPYQQYELKPGWCGDSFTFGLYDSTDGITNIVAQLTNHVDWTQVVYTNNSDSAVMLAWAFAYADDGRNNGGGTGWVDRVTWTQDGGAAGEATPMYGVPYSWLRANFPAYASADADTLNALGDGDSPIGKEMQVWQDYMAGTNPNDLNDLFRANIVVSNDMAHITWRPDLSVTGEPKRVYHVWGSSVWPAEWGIVQSNVVKELEVEMSAPGGSGVPAHRFFKVEVNWEESQKKN